MKNVLTYVMSILIISVAAFIVWWFLIEDPFEKSRQDLEDKKKREESRYQGHLRDKAQIEKIEAQIEDLKVEIFKILCKARGRSLEQFLKEIEDDSDASTIKLESIRIESVITKELYSHIPLDFNVSGPYFILYNFLARVQQRGKMDFSQGQLSISQETRMEPIGQLNKYVDGQAYKPNDQFPRLRITLNGEIIIIDDDQLDRYKTKKLTKCPEENS